ncbi:MAG: EAL domain-containing protein [Cyanobacteria bacterium P01_A01_bin.84]
MNDPLYTKKQDILIVDDTADNLRVLSSILVREGYNVRKALNWQMALTACKTLAPDIILLDIMMPEVDGYQVCERLKSLEITADIPIIFISALDDVFDKVKAFQVGGSDYITKPFEFEEVLVRIQNQLAFQTAQKEIQQLNSTLEERIKERTQELENTLQRLRQEIGERRNLQNQLIDIALHDSLTGLPNRLLFVQQLKKALSRAKQEKSYRFAVLFLDCDRFKMVNDSLGHLIGDELLLAISARLQSVLNNQDTLARFGGDEFAILLEELTDIETAITVAEKILEKLSLAFNLSRYEIFMNASIGIIWGNHEYEQPEHLLRDVDTAMYRAKDNGRARYHIFNPLMHQEAIKLLELENDLRRAIDREEFLLYYQPIISLTTGKISGFEALVRWQHPSRGLLSPNDFIPLAEETGLIVAINTWVLETACQHLNHWQNNFAGKWQINISINLSTRLFSQPDLISKIDKIIETTQVNPNYLELEITETAIMEYSQSAKDIIKNLRQREIRLIMDDFGTGYSSLTYLHSLPVSGLKIDQSFVKIMQSNPDNMGLVPAIVSIAHSMGISAIAEGVETKKQLSQLRSFNCDFAQGYLFSEAVSHDKVLSIIVNAPQW